MLPTLQMLPITLRHHFDFGAERGLVGDDLIRAEAWDALRTQTSGPFALPADRDAWEAAADNPALHARAEALSTWLDELSVGRLASYGVGAGGLELWLHRLAPARQLVVTEYAPETVARLGHHFEGVEVRAHDLLADPPVEADLHLFHRVDTEFDNRQWRAIVGRFADLRVLLVAAEILGPRALVNELRTRLTRRTSSRAGWLRNRAAFRALWRTTHAATPARIGDLECWLLTPIRPGPA
jgi:hypothetical protein